jgi:CRP-like cAMP-binding protein
MVSLEILKKAELFEGLSDDDLAAIAKHARLETYEAGTRIFAEGEVAKDIYVVHEGRVAVMIGIGQGKQTIVDTVSRGGTLAWSALVEPHILTSTAKSVDKSTLVAIPGEDLDHICESNCRLCYTIMAKIAAVISRRLQNTRLQLLSLMYG